ncbi:flagellar protein FliT [Conexibacter sp. SYSU D00693]|uniref:flagellar protein FliT n=1 Tax=Conexibacter sp. SYSU D00693 TaxID=2812560 RepID=UPI00196A62C6|nr:flagellar protein FliT [Conexibacter sp. SYSU D00693]
MSPEQAAGQLLAVGREEVALAAREDGWEHLEELAVRRAAALAALAGGPVPRELLPVLHEALALQRAAADHLTHRRDALRRELGGTARHRAGVGAYAAAAGVA